MEIVAVICLMYLSMQWIFFTKTCVFQIMDKKRLVTEGAVQQSKDEATIQVFLMLLLMTICNMSLSVVISRHHSSVIGD